MILILKPKCIDKLSFYLDYPELPKSRLCFLDSRDTAGFILSTKQFKQYIVYGGFPFRECRDIVTAIKQQGIKEYSNANKPDLAILCESSEMLDTTSA